MPWREPGRFPLSRPAAVRLEEVSKSFGGFLAVDRLSLQVPCGAIYGLIGPNGSGKTTTLRMMLSLTLPDRGSITVLGLQGASAARDRVSYLPEERGLYRKMPVRQVLRYFGLLKGASAASLDGSVPAWLARLGLSAWADKTVETLSKGMAQKVQFLAALVSRPELIILDEPFSGLDPASVEGMKAILFELRAAGRTIIFSTHQMASAEELCDRIGMVLRGRLALEGTLAQMQRAHPLGSVRVRTNRSLRFLRGLKGLRAAEQLDGFQVLDLDGDPQRFLRLLMKHATVRHFELRRPTLNDIFLKLSTKTEPDRAAA